MVARDWNATSHFLTGGDDSGFHATTFSTNNWPWATSNAGMTATLQMSIAAVAFRRFQPGGNTEVYAGYGAGTGGMLKSSNGGQTWSQFGITSDLGGPKFQAHSPGNAPLYNGQPYPRPTGNLIVLDESGSTLRHIWVGTFGQGVMQANDPNGNAWTSIALSPTNPVCSAQGGCVITSLIQDQAVSTTLWAASFAQGVYRIDTSTCPPVPTTDCATTTLLPASPGPITDPEELAMSQGTLLCACGRLGFYKGVGGNASLQQSNGGANGQIVFDQDPNHPTSISSIAVRPNNVNPIYVGAYDAFCELDNSGCHTVYKTVDGAVSWTDVVKGKTIDTTVAGLSTPWWIGADNRIDRKNFNAAYVALTADVPPRVVVSGHSGVWVTYLNDDTHWEPAVQNLGVTINRDAAVDPHAGNQAYAYVGDTDWTVFASNDHLGTVTQQTAQGSGAIAGFALATDQRDSSQTPSDVYLAAGDPDNPGTRSGNGPYKSTNPLSLGFGTLGVLNTSCPGQQYPWVIGIGVGEPSVNHPIALAATDGCGMWRYDSGTSQWSSVTGSTNMFTYTENQAFSYAPVIWPSNGGQVVYALDKVNRELFESADAGQTWTGVYPVTDAIDPDTGYMAVDQNSAGTVWITTSAQFGVHKLSCKVKLPLAPCTEDTTITTVAYPGPIAVKPCSAAPCAVYIATRSVPGSSNPTLYRGTSPWHVAWTALTTGNSLYAGGANFPRQLAISSDASAYAYVTTGGNGTIVVSGV